MDRAIQVRPASLDDAASIAAIYRPYVLNDAISFELEAPTAEEMAARIARTLQLGFPYIVATRDEIIAGYAYTSPFRTRAAYSATVESSIYVREDVQRQGVGRALLNELIRLSALGGKHQMIAVIADPLRNHPSVALHASLGFYQVGVLKNVGVKFGKAWDTLLMQRELSAWEAVVE